MIIYSFIYSNHEGSRAYTGHELGKYIHWGGGSPTSMLLRENRRTREEPKHKENSAKQPQLTSLHSIELEMLQTFAKENSFAWDFLRCSHVGGFQRKPYTCSTFTSRHSEPRPLNKLELFTQHVQISPSGIRHS